MRQTPRNVLFILQQHKRGAPAHVIYHRCAERLVWDGPLPSVTDILRITGTPGPAVDAARSAGVVPAGAVGPGSGRGET